MIRAVMRKLILSFLALLMMTPSLVCFMAVCVMPQQAHADSAVSSGSHEEPGSHKSGVPPCHESGTDTMPVSGSIMLVQDCMGVDFSAADLAGETLLKTANMDHSIPYPAFYSDVDAMSMMKHSSRLIRGPPRDAAALISSVSLPVYMATQRFRI